MSITVQAPSTPGFHAFDATGAIVFSSAVRGEAINHAVAAGHPGVVSATGALVWGTRTPVAKTPAVSGMSGAYRTPSGEVISGWVEEMHFPGRVTIAKVTSSRGADDARYFRVCRGLDGRLEEHVEVDAAEWRPAGRSTLAAPAKAPAKAAKPRTRPAASGNPTPGANGCSKARLQKWAAKYGAEVATGPDAVVVTILEGLWVAGDSAGHIVVRWADHENARAAYGAALAAVKQGLVA